MTTLLIHNDGSTGTYTGLRTNTIQHEYGTYTLHQWTPSNGVRIPYYKAVAYTGSVIEARAIVRDWAKDNIKESEVDDVREFIT